MNCSLTGKNILVTGASSGIGKSIALYAINAGANVFVVGRRLKLLHEIYSQKEYCIEIDLLNNDSIEDLVEWLPKLDGIVHAAGLVPAFKPFSLTNNDQLRNLFDINFYAPVTLTRALTKKKKLASAASIIFISSIVGVNVSSKANFDYTATKSAISGAVRSLALDFSPKKIRVNNIAPAMIETEGISQILEQIDEEQLKIDLSKYPLGSYGKPEDVASACIFLLSDHSKWITGSTLVIDGGFTLL